jgi:hypothetical protein
MLIRWPIVTRTIAIALGVTLGFTAPRALAQTPPEPAQPKTAAEPAPATSSAAEPAQPATLPPQTAQQQAEATRAASANQPTPKPAQPDQAPEAAPKPRPEDAVAPGEGDNYGHGRQLGLRAGLVGGYQMVFRYDESPFCKQPDPIKLDKDQQKFCGHQSPLALDLALSFGVFDALEPFVWGRFGFKGVAETNTKPLMLFGAGVRVYTMSDSRFKVFIEPALGLEIEKGYGNADWKPKEGDYKYKTDLIFHVAAGPQFDIAKAVGIYMGAGITAGVLRSLHTDLILTAGLQFRAP